MKTSRKQFEIRSKRYARRASLTSGTRVAVTYHVRQGVAAGVIGIGVYILQAGLAHAEVAAPTSSNDAAATSPAPNSTEVPGVGAVSSEDAARLAQMAQTVDRYNNLNIKGWDIPFGLISDTVLGDTGGFRSALGDRGFGFVASTMTSSAYNLAGTHYPDDPISYWGQKMSTMVISQALLTYDMSRHGIPDGQIVLGVGNSYATWEQYVPNRTAINTLSWYQTLFNKTLELKIGYVGNGTEWMGTSVGGSSVNPLGQSAAIPTAMGLTSLPFSQPTIRMKWNITANAYAQIGVMRSFPINGPTGNVQLDDWLYNGSGLRFSEPNAGRLMMGEVGYQRVASPEHKFLWVRVGVMDNSSRFTNFATGGTTDGAKAYYGLLDVQLTQPHPGSLFTAHEGLYLAASYMRAPAKSFAFYEQLEVKAYYYAPFGKSRPYDQLSLVLARSNISNYLVAAVNGNAASTGVYAATRSDVTTLMYTAYLGKGVWATLGGAFTRNPTITYKKPKDTSSSLLFSLYARF